MSSCNSRDEKVTDNLEGLRLTIASIVQGVRAFSGKYL